MHNNIEAESKMNQKTKKFTKRFEWDEKITSPHPQPFSLMRRREKSAAFTLMETLITVVILGILAAILVPNLIKNQVENANRTKVKKAMAAYEKAINFMIVENDIKSTETLRELGQGNCQYTREYFKIVQDGSNNCIFKTADRVWWDITDITNPILILKDSQLDKSETELKTLAKNVNDNTTFAMVGRFDDLGTLRINDNAYEQGLENNLANQKYVGKLWYFITQSTSVLTGLQKCDAQKETTCTITSNGISATYTKIITNTDTKVDKDHNNNKLCLTGNCEYVSVALAGEYWISDNLGKLTEEEAKNMNDSVCTHTYCITNGDYYAAAKRKCSKSGGHLASLAELSIARNNNKMGSGWYWASEESNLNNSYYVTNIGTVYNYLKGMTNGQVICVGND